MEQIAINIFIWTWNSLFSHRNTGMSTKNIVQVVILLLLHSSLVIHGDLNGGCFLGAHFTDKDIPLTTFQPNATSPQYYRFFYIDDATSSLFVGAKNTLIRLNLTDISNNSESTTLSPIASELNLCVIRATEVTCQNHIRYIVRTSASEIFACGTGSKSPLVYNVKFNSNNSLNITSITTKYENYCPYNPFDNATQVYIETGNPAGEPAIYSGIIGEYSSPVISRPELRYPNGTIASGELKNHEDMNWLNEPQFAASFGVGDQVFFFFREVAVEFTNCEKKIVSRVAKVCKSDKGGNSALTKKWTSFQKARLNCSIPGEFPYYFDEIQDVVFNNNTFYGLFTTNINGVSASAICAFQLSAIQDAFAGEFKYQVNAQSYWLPYPQDDVPAEARQCVNNSIKLSDEVEQFMNTKPMMDRAVRHQYGEPMFTMGGKLMQKLAMDKKRSTDDKYIFFTGSNSGDVYKLMVAINESDDKPRGIVANKFSVLKKAEPIWALELQNDQIYIGTDSSITQFSVLTCDRHTRIDKCLYDPYCNWSSLNTNSPWYGSCVSKSSTSDGGDMYTFEQLGYLKSSYLAAMATTSEDTLSFQELNTTTLRFDYPFSLGGKTVQWKFAKDSTSMFVPLEMTGKYHIDSEYSLIISKFNDDDAGRYQAVTTEDDGTEVVLLQRTLQVGTRANAEQLWMARFEEWCVEFNKYKQRGGQPCTQN